MALHVNMESKISTVDTETPRNAHLSAFYRRSPAYHTMKERLPVILTQTIDGLVRHKEKIIHQYGLDGKDELKAVIGEISRLNYELQTNKPMQRLTINSPDVEFYNRYLSEQEQLKSGECTYFNALWLHSECYVYRRLREIFELTTHLNTFDPFKFQKEEAYPKSLVVMVGLAQYLLNMFEKKAINVGEEFKQLLRFNLWGNKFDLSFYENSPEEPSSAIGPVAILREFEPMIISDHSDVIWNLLSSNSNESSEIIIDVVCDNVGYEVFTDLCFGDFLLTMKLAHKIRFYVKAMPWFVSDATMHDFHWLIRQLHNNSNDSLKQMGLRWSNYLAKGKWVVVEDWFWSLPVDYSYMQEVKPDLYNQLSEAAFIFFKGDLNYRKLFGEKFWDPATSLKEALGEFCPSKLVVLRTVKCHMVVGLKSGLAEQLRQKDENWMETGDYGVIQCYFR